MLKAPYQLFSLPSFPFCSSKQRKNNTSVKMPWRTGSSFPWKWLPWSSLSGVLQSAVPWYTKEGGDTLKCVVSALREQDLPDSLQPVLQDNYQHFRGGDMWNDCALPPEWFGIFNGIEITQFLSCWSFPDISVINSIFKVVLSYKGTAGIGDPTCSLKAWINQIGPQAAQGFGGTRDV